MSAPLSPNEKRALFWKQASRRAAEMLPRLLRLQEELGDAPPAAAAALVRAAALLPELPLPRFSCRSIRVLLNDHNQPSGSQVSK